MKQSRGLSQNLSKGDPAGAFIDTMRRPHKRAIFPFTAQPYPILGYPLALRIIGLREHRTLLLSQLRRRFDCPDKVARQRREDQSE
jgi:hypothetical protein